VYKHPVQLLGFNLGAFIHGAPHLFGQVMGELLALLAAGVVEPARPATYKLEDGAQALLDLESRATAGKLALLP
jgi:NADPH2:quinone reductase